MNELVLRVDNPFNRGWLAGIFAVGRVAPSDTQIRQTMWYDGYDTAFDSGESESFKFVVAAFKMKVPK